MLRKYFRLIVSTTICLLLFLAVSAPLLRGQAVATASITGRVTDAQNAVLVGAQVAITSVDTGVVYRVTTNNDGIYTEPNLQIGSYSLHVSARGFQDYVQHGIQLEVGNKAQINVTMSVGQTTQTVVVTENVSLVQTQTSNLSQVVDTRRINLLP